MGFIGRMGLMGCIRRIGAMSPITSRSFLSLVMAAVQESRRPEASVSALPAAR